MDAECSTCMEAFTSKCNISTTLCGHVFHIECISKWLANEKSCPQCRKPCTEKGMIKIYLSGSEESRRRRLENERAAADKVNLEMHQWLFENNPKNNNGQSLLHWAAGNGHEKICEQILDNYKGTSPGCDRDLMKSTPLHYAAEKGNTDIVKMLLDIVDDKNPKNTGGSTPLHYAAKFGHVEIYKKISEVVEDKNPRDIQGFTPLHIAASNGHTRMCKIIMYRTKEKNPRSNNGLTPLHYAAKFGHTDIFRILIDRIDRIEDKNPKDVKGNTPLHKATNSGHLEIVRIIRVRIIEINPKNNVGCTPLHIAANKGTLEIFKSLISNVHHVEDVLPEMYDGKTTPLHYAIQNGHEEIYNVIISNLRNLKIFVTDKLLLYQASLAFPSKSDRFPPSKKLKLESGV